MEVGGSLSVLGWCVSGVYEICDWTFAPTLLLPNERFEDDFSVQWKINCLVGDS